MTQFVQIDQEYWINDELIVIIDENEYKIMIADPVIWHFSHQDIFYQLLKIFSSSDDFININPNGKKRLVNKKYIRRVDREYIYTSIGTQHQYSIPMEHLICLLNGEPIPVSKKTNEVRVFLPRDKTYAIFGLNNVKPEEAKILSEIDISGREICFNNSSLRFVYWKDSIKSQYHQWVLHCTIAWKPGEIYTHILTLAGKELRFNVRDAQRAGPGSFVVEYY